MSTQAVNSAEASLGEPRRGFARSRVGGLAINLILIVVIVLSVLWLPPLSLSKRFVEGGYTTLGEEVWSVIDPDGTQFTVLPEGLQGRVKAKLASVPKLDFMEGAVEDNLVAAAAAKPTHIDIKSPVYRLALNGDLPTAAVLTVPIPNDALPYETLDLYAWSGIGWEWVPSRVIEEEDVVIAELDRVTEQMDFVVAQTHILPPVISADLTGSSVPEAAIDTIVELNPRVFALGDNGQILGVPKVDVSPGAPFTVVPILSNWGQDGVVRNDLVDNLLVDTGLRQAHIDAIVEAVVTNNLHGIEIDYRAINPGLRGAFNEFIAELADVLHQRGKVLAVRVEYPRQIAYDRWDTGVFDWRTLGRSVDAIKVPSVPDPQAYVPGGLMDQLIRWATVQVHRHKLQFILSTRSVDLRGTNPSFVTYAEAMAPFTNVVVEGGRDRVNVEEHLVCSLSTGQGGSSIMYDEGAHTYWFRYRDERNEEHTVWLENAASIAHKLKILARYNLRGVAFEHLLDDGASMQDDEQVWQVVHEFHTLTIPTMTDQFAVVWTVKDEAGQTIDRLTTSLADPHLDWVAPKQTGAYTVLAAVSSDGKSTIVQGQTVVQVGLPGSQGPETSGQEPGETEPGEEQAPGDQLPPTPTPVSEATPTPTPEPTPEPTKVVAMAGPEATVTNNVLNLRAGPGTNYAAVGQVRKGDELKILGKNPQGTWIKIAAPDGTTAWVIVDYVSLNIALADIPLAEVPPAPTAAPQPTKAPAGGGGGAAPLPSSTGFGYGIQAHCFNNLPQVINMTKGLGFGWIKQQVRWQHTESERGKYSWGSLDAIADGCSASGVKLLFSVVAAPAWSRGGRQGDGPPDNYQDFYNFMGAMAAHFKGRVQAYEIWNEQNLQREWEGSPLSAADYVRLLKGAYQAVKAADPNAKVISGAPTPTGINDGVWAIADRVYLQQMYDAGLKYYCDGVGAHPSGYANPPDVYYQGGDYDPRRGYDDHPSFFFRNTMEDYYRIMAQSGDGAKRIWATEFGWPTNSGMGVPPSPNYEFAQDINEQQQADYIVRAYTWARNWGHAGVMFLWNLNFWPTVGAQNEMAKYSIVRGDWSPRPAYIALQNMPK